MVTLLSIFGVNFFTQIIKKGLTKYGDFGVHIIVLCLCIIGACIYALVNAVPSYMELAKQVIKILVSAVGFYEIVWKRIGALLDSVDTSSLTMVD